MHLASSGVIFCSNLSPLKGQGEIMLLGGKQKMFAGAIGNPCLDAITFAAAPYGARVNAVENPVFRIGGNWTNTFCALRRRSPSSRCVALGFEGGRFGQEVLNGLRQRDIEADFVRIADPSGTRLNTITIVNDPEDGIQEYRNNSVGPTILPSEAAELRRRIQSLDVSNANVYAAVCGRPPQGVTAEMQRLFIGDFVGLDATVYFNAPTDVFSEVLEREPRPHVVVPNLVEISRLAEPAFRTDPNIGNLEKHLHKLCGKKCGCSTDEPDPWWGWFNKRLLDVLTGLRGVEVMVVTMGNLGMLLCYGKTVIHARLRRLEKPVITTVGAGDTTLAMIMWARMEGKPWDEVMQWAVAGASTAVTKPILADLDPSVIESFLPDVEVHEHKF